MSTAAPPSGGGTTTSLSPLPLPLAWSKATVAGAKATTLRQRERAGNPKDLDSDILRLLSAAGHCQPDAQRAAASLQVKSLALGFLLRVSAVFGGLPDTSQLVAASGCSLRAREGRLQLRLLPPGPEDQAHFHGVFCPVGPLAGPRQRSMVSSGFEQNQGLFSLDIERVASYRAPWKGGREAHQERVATLPRC